MRWKLWACVLTLWATLAGAGSPEHGLLWNRTGLPAVFPLQVKTVAGMDTLLTLQDAETGASALAAYIEGGRFFRVLVPPGTFILHFDQGKDWQSDAELFGSTETRSFELSRPLTFRIVGSSVKQGHLVDLTDPETGITIKQRFVCQGYRIARPPRPQAPFDDLEGYATRLQEPGDLVQYPNPRQPDRLAKGVTRPIVETDFAPYFSQPEFEIGRIPC